MIVTQTKEWLACLEELPVALPNDITYEFVDEDGLMVLHFKYGSVTAVVGCGFTNKGRFATVYRLVGVKDVQAVKEAKHLLKLLKTHHQGRGYDFGYSTPSTVLEQGAFYGLGIKPRFNELIVA